MVDLIRTNFLRYLNGKAYVDNDQTIGKPVQPSVDLPEIILIVRDPDERPR